MPPPRRWEMPPARIQAQILFLSPASPWGSRRQRFVSRVAHQQGSAVPCSARSASSGLIFGHNPMQTAWGGRTERVHLEPLTFWLLALKMQRAGGCGTAGICPLD